MYSDETIAWVCSRRLSQFSLNRQASFAHSILPLLEKRLRLEPKKKIFFADEVVLRENLKPRNTQFEMLHGYSQSMSSVFSGPVSKRFIEGRRVERKIGNLAEKSEI